jgi:uncharacterized protein
LKFGNKKILKIALIVVACLLVIYLVISVLGAKKAMDVPRRPLSLGAGSLGVAYQDVAFNTRNDNLTLKGWFFPGVNGRVIIFVHGGFQNRIDDNADTPGLARALIDKGYSILLFDLRGRGESEGKGISLSYIDEDIGGAVDYVRSRGYNIEDICLLGFCSGATMASIYGSRNEIGSMILDGCFIDCGTMVIRQAEYINVPGWVARVLTPGGTLTTFIMYGYHRIDPIDVIPDIKCPLFFIHEEFDAFTTMKETQRMFDKSSNPANEFLELTNAGHSQGFRVHPQEYIDRVDSFLQKIHLP